jgi:AmmeMemoRadiSam system protein B
MRGGVRLSAVAGTWYPGDASSLRAEVDRYLADVPESPIPGRLVALVSPHAGLRYSGAVAAHAYARLRGRRDLTVVLVGPSHRLAFHGVSAWVRGSFATPLGEIPIDEEAAEAVVRAGEVVRDDPGPHRDEHSLEMQLPFLQHVVPGLRLVPLLMGSQSRDEVDALAQALAKGLAGREALLVASSDLSHYHPAREASALDAKVVGDVERFDPERLMDRLESFHGHACGGGPMVAVLKAARARGADRATVLRYADSGDAGEHDKSRVVGYLAAALSAVPESPGT